MFATLDGKTLVPTEDVLAWAHWFQNTDGRRVAVTEIGQVQISTVCLGINHGFSDHPLWFETLVFGGEFDQEQERYETWEEAEAGHAAMVKKVTGN